MSFARDVEVSGHTRKNGTYVQPHIRSSPDKYKANNYGSSNGNTFLPKEQRDADRDGIPNYRDVDDDNDGIHDDNE